MGAAKHKKAQRQKDFLLTKKMPRARFDLYALGTRRSFARVLAEELSWWSDIDEKVIGLVFRDRPDDDYGWIMLARDRVSPPSRRRGRLAEPAFHVANEGQVVGCPSA